MENKDIIELMNSNTDKMNFQQTMCFQMKNWAIVITIGIIGVVWSNKINLPVSVVCHLLLIGFLLYLRKHTINWKDGDNALYNLDETEICKEKSDLKTKKDYFYVILIAFAMFSLLTYLYNEYSCLQKCCCISNIR